MKKIVREYTASGKAYYVEINEEDYRFFIYNQYKLGKITKEEFNNLKKNNYLCTNL
jgi:hypothetical protein